MNDRDKLGLIAQYILCEDTKLYNDLQDKLNFIRRTSDITFDDLISLQKYIVQRDYFDIISHILIDIMIHRQ